MPQEFWKHAIPDCVVRGTDLFSLRVSDKKMTTANTRRAIQCEWIKIMPIFCQISKKSIFFVCCRMLVISLQVPWGENVENLCAITITVLLLPIVLTFHDYRQRYSEPSSTRLPAWVSEKMTPGWGFWAIGVCVHFQLSWVLLHCPLKWLRHFSFPAPHWMRIAQASYSHQCLILRMLNCISLRFLFTFPWF